MVNVFINPYFNTYKISYRIKFKQKKIIIIKIKTTLRILNENANTKILEKLFRFLYISLVRTRNHNNKIHYN